MFRVSHALVYVTYHWVRQSLAAYFTELPAFSCRSNCSCTTAPCPDEDCGPGWGSPVPGGVGLTRGGEAEGPARACWLCRMGEPAPRTGDTRGELGLLPSPSPFGARSLPPLRAPGVPPSLSCAVGSWCMVVCALDSAPPMLRRCTCTRRAAKQDPAVTKGRCYSGVAPSRRSAVLWDSNRRDSATVGVS